MIDVPTSIADLQAAGWLPWSRWPDVGERLVHTHYPEGDSRWTLARKTLPKRQSTALEMMVAAAMTACPAKDCNPDEGCKACGHTLRWYLPTWLPVRVHDDRSYSAAEEPFVELSLLMPGLALHKCHTIRVRASDRVLLRWPGGGA